MSNHNPASPPSNKALSLLKAAVSGPYPPEKSTNPPLDFKLEVVESPPTSDQLRTILSYLSSPQQQEASAPSLFLSAHPSSPLSSQGNTSLSKIVEIGSKNPNSFKWPVVVNWTAGKACVGDVECVKGILEQVRRKRDGEEKEDDVDKPKGWFS
ncbi:hypothetical protein VNI00_006949 [Paramarasmius palmivorus]|uniref:Uncharacterized protein n=1 Tax=Paramarasmius palmivorus TaxID=297713 RepID=A0AAW0D3Z3_9AGAR